MHIYIYIYDTSYIIYYLSFTCRDMTATIKLLLSHNNNIIMILIDRYFCTKNVHSSPGRIFIDDNRRVNNIDGL